MGQNQSLHRCDECRRYAGILKVTPDNWYILGALSQLERELIRERVKAGLAAAKLRGSQIGRKKLRDSVLIRSLLKNGLSFRKVAVIAKCSHGSISAEKKDMLREEAELNAKIEAQMRLLPAPEERPVGPDETMPPA